MNSNKWTPGPWKKQFEFDYEPIYLVSEGNLIATVAPDNLQEATEEFGEVNLANARLIAAAPELYEALQGILEIGKRDMSNPKYDGYFNTAKEALAKARGEQ